MGMSPAILPLASLIKDNPTFYLRLIPHVKWGKMIDRMADKPVGATWGVMLPDTVQISIVCEQSIWNF
jgi:hypothetical protein